MTKRAPKATPIPDEQQPWNATQYAYLTAQRKTRNWLLLSDEEAQALAEGVVLARTQASCRKMIQPIGGLG